MSNADYSADERAARRQSWAGRQCPIKGCQQRFLTAGGAGRHLDQAHNERGRWAATRLDTIRVDNDETILFDAENEQQWIQSSLVVEAPQ